MKTKLTTPEQKKQWWKEIEKNLYHHTPKVDKIVKPFYDLICENADEIVVYTDRETERLRHSAWVKIKGRDLYFTFNHEEGPGHHQGEIEIREKNNRGRVKTSLTEMNWKQQLSYINYLLKK